MTVKNQPKGNERSFWTPSRLALSILVLSLIATIGVSSCTSNDEQPPAARPVAGAASSSPNNVARNNQPAARPEPAVAGPTLPPNVRDVSMRSVDGAAIRLSDYAGKVLLVNLWATWCGPCRSEIPELVKLHKEFQSQGLEMVGLSTEDPDRTAQGVRDFVRQYGMDYHVGWAAPEVENGLMQLSQSGNIPQSFIISREGRVLKRFIGFSPVATPPQIRQAIEDALNGKG